MDTNPSGLGTATGTIRITSINRRFDVYPIANDSRIDSMLIWDMTGIGSIQDGFNRCELRFRDQATITTGPTGSASTLIIELPKQDLPLMEQLITTSTLENTSGNPSLLLQYAQQGSANQFIVNFRLDGQD